MLDLFAIAKLLLMYIHTYIHLIKAKGHKATNMPS